MRSRALAAVSAVQLVAGLVGLRRALQGRHAYEFLWLRGKPEHVGRDALSLGTALSAPGPMLAAQAAALAVLSTRDDPRAELVLGGLGAAMVGGYLGERLVRTRLTPAGWEPFESTVAITGMSLAAAMAALGLRRRAT